MKMCVSLFPLPHLSNPVRTNPTAGVAEVEWCFEARYVDAWNRHDWVVTRICRIAMGGKEMQRSQTRVESVETRFGHLHVLVIGNRRNAEHKSDVKKKERGHRCTI